MPLVVLFAGSVSGWPANSVAAASWLRAAGSVTADSVSSKLKSVLTSRVASSPALRPFTTKPPPLSTNWRIVSRAVGVSAVWRAVAPARSGMTNAVRPSSAVAIPAADSSVNVKTVCPWESRTACMLADSALPT